MVVFATALAYTHTHRGGDLNKWFDCGIKFVRGIDISPHSIEEATTRLGDLRRRKKRDIPYVFEQRDGLLACAYIVSPRGE